MKKVALLCLAVFLLIPSLAFSQRKTDRKGKDKSYSLTVASNVQGASVKISGKESASGKASFSAKLPEGDYSIEVSASGYKTSATKVSLKKDQSITVNLEPLKGKVVIFPGKDRNKKDIQAGEFQVYDNGNLLPSGMTFELSPGQHTIQVVSGAFMAQTTLDIAPGRTYQIEPVIDLRVK